MASCTKNTATKTKATEIVSLNIFHKTQINITLIVDKQSEKAMCIGIANKIWAEIWIPYGMPPRESY